ncbi:MAG: transcriptional regulator, partial [Janthinobacterium lividum]
MLRLSLHPLGLAPRIANLGQWRHHLLTRLQQQIDNSGDVTLRSLKSELSSYPFTASPTPPANFGGIAVPLRLCVPGLPTPLSFISTTTVFGTPVDVTLSELALECFYPADDAT